MSNKGFTIMEIIVAMFILAIAIIPMVNAYSPAVSSAGGEEEMTVLSQRARGTLHRILDLGYDTLNSNRADPADLIGLFGSAEEANKETFVFKGKTYIPQVAITEKNPGEEGLLEVRVSIEHVSVKTLKADF